MNQVDKRHIFKAQFEKSELQLPCNCLKYQIADDQTPLQLDMRLLRSEICERTSPISYTHPVSLFSRIFLFAEGSCVLTRNNKQETLLPGKIYLLPIGMPFDVDYAPSIHLYIHIHLVDSRGRDVFSRFDDVRCIEDHNLFSLLYEAASKERPELDGLVLSTAVRFAEPLVDEIKEQIRNTEHFKGLFEYIQNHKVAMIRIEDLAKVVGTSKGALSKDFYRRMGQSLKSYLESIDQKRAVEYLLYSSKSIKEIAYDLGYHDPSYFHRTFKKRTGMTPAAFRRQGS